MQVWLFNFNSILNHTLKLYLEKQKKMVILLAQISPEVFLGKGILNICSKFTGEPPRRRVISITLLCTFIEMTLRHGCSPVILLHIFRTLFPKNTSGGLFLSVTWTLLVALILQQILKFFFVSLCEINYQNESSSIFILAEIICISKQPPDVFCEKSVLKNLANFTGKNLW